MLKFHRRKIVNKLTQLINNNPETKVKDVLSCEDLSLSIRQNVPELLDFFSPPLPSPPNIERPINTILNCKKLDKQNYLYWLLQWI